MKSIKAILTVLIVMCFTSNTAHATYIGHYTVKTVYVDELSQTIIRFYENIAAPAHSNCIGQVNSVVLPDHADRRKHDITQQKIRVAMDSLQTKTKVAVYVYDDCVNEKHQLASIGATKEFAPLIP